MKHVAVVLTVTAALLVLPARAVAPTHNTGMHTLADEDAVDDAVRDIIAGMTHPERLLAHTKSVAGVETMAGASDCMTSLNRLAVGLAKAEMWALQMIDSSSKLITGVLYGNLADLGNFDECVASGSVDANGFTGKYALPSLDLMQAQPQASGMAAQLHDVLRAAAGAHRRLPSLNGRQVRVHASGNETVEYSSLASLRIAMCVPSTCPAQVIEAGMNQGLDMLNALLRSTGFRLQAHLPDVYTTEAGAWRSPEPADWVVITLCTFLVLLVVVGTTLDLALAPNAKQSRQKLGILVAFSAWTNGRRLLHISPPSDSNFTCINGIRFFSAMWVVLGHRYANALQVPFMNLIVLPDRVNDVSAMMIGSAPLSVDTFFLIGGMVNCYAFMKMIKGRRCFNVLMYYVHRYVRLTPAFALMVGITATWIALLGNGPLWYMVVGDASNSCKRNWWSALLYVANYATPTDQCMMQSWYLMVDMQLHWLSPLLLIPLWKYPKAGLAWGFVLLVASCLSPFLITYFYELPAPMSVDIRMSAQYAFLKQMYYPTHTRATSYVFGTLVGYFLYLNKSGQIKLKLTHTQVVLGWLASATLCLTVIFGEQPLLDRAHHPYDVLEASFYQGFHRIAWSFGITWVVLACILGYGGPVNALLSWAPLTVLGRLTYGIYLTHAAVQMVDHGSMRSSDYYSDFKMVERMFSDVVIASFLGACLCLTLESPVMAIEKALRSGSGGPRPRRDGENALQNAKTDNGLPNPAFVVDDGQPAPSSDGAPPRSGVSSVA